MIFKKRLLATDCSYVLLEMLKFTKFLCKGFLNLSYTNALKYFLVKYRIPIFLLLHSTKFEVSRLFRIVTCVFD